MKPVRKLVAGGVIAGAGILGAIGAASLGTASAAPAVTAVTAAAGTDASTGSTTATDATASTDASETPKGPHQANGITETELTGDDLAKATAAAQAAVPDGTVVRAETDADGATYEVHMTKADGSEVTVELDASFTVTATETGGHGGGGHKGGGHRNGETELTGDDLTKATAAAQAALPDGTVVRAETDADGATYEVHMTKADGSEVTVKLDAGFTVTSTIDGKG